MRERVSENEISERAQTDGVTTQMAAVLLMLEEMRHLSALLEKFSGWRMEHAGCKLQASVEDGSPSSGAPSSTLDRLLDKARRSLSEHAGETSSLLDLEEDGDGLLDLIDDDKDDTSLGVELLDEIYSADDDDEEQEDEHPKDVMDGIRKSLEEQG